MKTIVITGASRGIGLATAELFLNHGWRVIGTYLGETIPVEHEHLTALQYDQGDSESVAHLVAQIGECSPHVDVLVNNAGVLLDPDDERIDPVKLRRTLEINVVGVVDLTERMVPLLERGAHIVNLNSGYGVISKPEFDDAACGAYRISKAALNMYTRHLAFRLKPSGIIVSALAPGWTQTDMGYSIATETEKPSRTPAEAAQDIYNLISTTNETGCFWEFGKKIEW